MVLRKAVKYGALALGALLLLGIVLSVVSAIVSAVVGIVMSIVAAVAALLVVAGLLYGGFKAGSWLRDDGRSVRPPPARPGSRPPTDAERRPSIDRRTTIDRLQRQYAEGRLSEAEFERKLERELDGGTGSIERESDRNRP